MTDRSNPPNRIRELRLARSLTLAQLARSSGCSVVQVSDLERGKRTLSLKWLTTLAGALGVAPGDLLLVNFLEGKLSTEEQLLVLRYRTGTPEMKFLINSISKLINRAV